MLVRIKVVEVTVGIVEVPDDYFEDKDGGCTLEEYVADHMVEYCDDIDEVVESYVQSIEEVEEDE